MFPLSNVPMELRCSHCNTYVMDLSLGRAFEVFAARALCARVAVACNPGFDVYESDRFPDCTFQVKVSSPGPAREEKRIIAGRDLVMRTAPIWSWSDAHADLHADFYLLFGINDAWVYPFLLSEQQWEEASSRRGYGRTLKISTRSDWGRRNRYRRRPSKPHKGWEFYVKEWPADLYAVLELLTK